MISKREEVGESPPFDEDNPDPILNWADAEIVWDDGTFIDGQGNESLYPQFASWSLIWKCGTMSLPHEGHRPNNCERARKMAALFIYLWTRGIEVGIASRCADHYPF